ncbi:MAG: retropepsin-like aspartic protease family protein [Neptuniibacter sp.]
MTPKRIGKGMWAIAWVLLLAMLYQFFDGQVEERYSPNQNLSSDPSSVVVLKRNRQGHYVAPGKINGTDVVFLLDTGATTVSIPSNVAEKIGLEYGRKQQVGTANGVIDVYSTKLSSVQLGGITMNNIRGHINPYMDNSTVLLGMSFMRDLEIIQKGDSLTLKL